MTHCKRGHEMTEENTIHRAGTHHVGCRECARINRGLTLKTMGDRRVKCLDPTCETMITPNATGKCKLHSGKKCEHPTCQVRTKSKYCSQHRRYVPTDRGTSDQFIGV
jgi:hypothetical protein